MASYVMRACPTCGRQRGVRYGDDTTCPPCRRLAALQPTEEHALSGGRWVAHGLIQVWIADESEVA